MRSLHRGDEGAFCLSLEEDGSNVVSSAYMSSRTSMGAARKPGAMMEMSQCVFVFLFLEAWVLRFL